MRHEIESVIGAPLQTRPTRVGKIVSAAALCAFLSSLLIGAPVTAQRRARRAPRVIVLDEMDCDMRRWDEPIFVPIAPEFLCPISALFDACGVPAPPSCPGDPSTLDLTAVSPQLAACVPSRASLVAFTQLIDRSEMPPALAPLVDRFATRVEELDTAADRVLLAELLRRLSRYASAVAILTQLVDDTSDPALRALAIDRLVAMLAYADWNEDGTRDDDFAEHVSPRLLATRPWALWVARRVLGRVECSREREALIRALTARFPGELLEPTSVASDAPPLGDFDPGSFRRAVAHLPLASCAPSEVAAVALLRAHTDGTVEAASTNACLSDVLDQPMAPAPLGGDAEARFVFIFVPPR